jgi:hypothetical protein
MFRKHSVLGPLVLGIALSAPLLNVIGCSAHVRYYDEYHGDYHYWDAGEDRSYRVWLGERHYDYREYNKLNKDQQRDYWNWRHDHPDHH